MNFRPISVIHVQYISLCSPWPHPSNSVIINLKSQFLSYSDTDMSEIFLNSQDSLADPFTIDPDPSSTHPLSTTRTHERRISQSTTPTSGGYFIVTDDAE